MRHRSAAQSAEYCSNMDGGTMGKRKTVLIFTALFALCTAAAAQSAAVGFSNQSSGTAFVISLPTDSREFAELRQSPNALKNLIRQYADRIVAVPSGGVYSSLPVYRQDTAVFGYVFLTGELIHPLFIIRIPSGSGGSYFALRDSDLMRGAGGAFLGFSGVEEDLPARGRYQVDGRILDWLQADDALRFARDFTPRRIRRESSDTSAIIALDDSVYWGRGGTSLDRLRLALDERMFYGMLTAFQEFQEGLSVLMYFYVERSDSARNLYAIEIPVLGEKGQVLLWTREEQAEVVGNFHRGDFVLEFQIHREFLPLEIQQALQGLRDGSFDISTGFTDGEIYEEFLYGNLPIRNLFSNSEGF